MELIEKHLKNNEKGLIKFLKLIGGNLFRHKLPLFVNI